MELVVRRFGLGRVVGEPVRVAGGLSNELWRVVTSGGVFAVKRMVVNAERAEFVGNVEAAYAVERRAFGAGVAMPEPVGVPGTSAALARVGGSLFRVHRWVEGRAPGAGLAVEAASLLAGIHAAGSGRRERLPGTEWGGDRWGAEVAGLARRVGAGPGAGLVVDSHRDLDPKNTLVGAGGTLLAVDWDAAGPVGAVHEAAALALDWSDGDPVVFASAVRAYSAVSGVAVPAEPWVFAGWVAAQGGWLDHQAGPDGSPSEAASALARLRRLADGLDSLLAAQF
jgi:hypothetical protein